MNQRSKVAPGIVAAVLLATIGGFIVIRPLNFNTSVNQFYVATTGNDINPGTQASPWLTITKAGNTVVAGATVHVASGTYGASTINNSGNSATPTTYVSDTRWGASIQGGGSYGITVVGDYVTVKDFDVTATTTNVGIQPGGNGDTVIGNHVHNVGSTGSCLTGGAGIDAFAHSGVYADQTSVLIQGNKVDTINQSSCFPTNFIHAIYATSSGVKIFDNIAGGNVYGYGLHCWHACNAPILSGNTVFNNAQGGIIIGTGDSGVIPVFDNAVVTDNISINNGAYGLREYSYDAAHMGTHNTWDRNNTFGNTTGSYLSDYSKNVDTNTKTHNPSMVNYVAAGSGDYHLNAGDADIDGGTSNQAPSVDFDGVTRPQGSGYDIGAYER